MSIDKQKAKELLDKFKDTSLQIPKGDTFTFDSIPTLPSSALNSTLPETVLHTGFDSSKIPEILDSAPSDSIRQQINALVDQQVKASLGLKEELLKQLTQATSQAVSTTSSARDLADSIAYAAHYLKAMDPKMKAALDEIAQAKTPEARTKAKTKHYTSLYGSQPSIRYHRRSAQVFTDEFLQTPQPSTPSELQIFAEHTIPYLDPKKMTLIITKHPARGRELAVHLQPFFNTVKQKMAPHQARTYQHSKGQPDFYKVLPIRNADQIYNQLRANPLYRCNIVIDPLFFDDVDDRTRQVMLQHLLERGNPEIFPVTMAPSHRSPKEYRGAPVKAYAARFGPLIIFALVDYEEGRMLPWSPMKEVARYDDDLRNHYRVKNRETTSLGYDYTDPPDPRQYGYYAMMADAPGIDLKIFDGSIHSVFWGSKQELTSRHDFCPFGSFTDPPSPVSIEDQVNPFEEVVKYVPVVFFTMYASRDKEQEKIALQELGDSVDLDLDGELG